MASRRPVIVVLLQSCVLACLLVAGLMSPAAASTSAKAVEPTGCGGEATVRWSGGRWHCTFSDDFDGSSLDTSKWQVVQTAWTGFLTGGAETPVCYNNDDTVSVGGGALTLKVKALDQPTWCGWPGQGFATRFEGGTVSTARLLEQTYGHFEVRAKFDGGFDGLHSAIWMWPANPSYGAWPASGEIDIAEYYSTVPGRVFPYVHYASSGYDPTVTSPSCFVNTEQYHTYSADWTRNTITLSVDGHDCVTTGWNKSTLGWWRQAAPFDKPFYAVLTQGLGINTNAFDPEDASKLPADMTVDHVYIWG